LGRVQTIAGWPVDVVRRLRWSAFTPAKCLPGSLSLEVETRSVLYKHLTGLWRYGGPVGRGPALFHGASLSLDPGAGLGRDLFKALAGRYPVLDQNLLRMVVRYLADLEERFRELATERVGPRVARQLVRLLPQIGRPMGPSK
jgi:hypothetical protein